VLRSDRREPKRWRHCVSRVALGLGNHLHLQVRRWLLSPAGSHPAAGLPDRRMHAWRVARLHVSGGQRAAEARADSDRGSCAAHEACAGHHGSRGPGTQRRGRQLPTVRSSCPPGSSYWRGARPATVGPGSRARRPGNGRFWTPRQTTEIRERRLRSRELTSEPRGPIGMKAQASNARFSGRRRWPARPPHGRRRAPPGGL
jgi:hypothetical protein